MTIRIIDEFDFPFNNGKGIRADQITGATVKSATQADSSAPVVLTSQLADDTESTVEIGILPTGSSALNKLQWNATGGVWESVSEATTRYYGITRSTDLAGLSEAVLYLNNNGLSLYPPAGTLTGLEPFSISNRFTRFGENDSYSSILNVWESGGSAPFVWVINPNHTDYIDNWTATYENYTVNPKVDIPITLTIERDKWRINGVGYDFAYGQITGPRPSRVVGPHGFDFGFIQIRYVAPAVTVTFTEQ